MRCFKIISNNTNDIVFSESLELLPDGRTVFKRADEIVFVAPISATIVNQDLEIDFIHGLEYLVNSYYSEKRKLDAEIEKNEFQFITLDQAKERKNTLDRVHEDLSKTIYNLKQNLKCI